MYKQNDGSTVVLFKDDSRSEVFLVFRSDFPIWVTTGGGITKGEIPKQAAIREAQEETGFKVKIIREVGVYSNLKHKSYLYEGRVISGKFKPEFLGCKGKWFKVTSLPFSMLSRTKEKIFNCIQHKGKPFEKKLKQLRLIDDLHLILFHPIASIKYISKYLINFN